MTIRKRSLFISQTAVIAKAEREAAEKAASEKDAAMVEVKRFIAAFDQAQLFALNRYVVALIKANRRDATVNFKLGDWVWFDARGQRWTGRVTKVGRSKITVRTDQGGVTWRVGADMLHHQE